MAHEIHYPILAKLGLSESEVLLYELLLESGRSKARDLIEPSGLGRGNVYNVLTQLQTKGLVLPIDGKQTLYEAVDPSSLQKLIDQQMNRMRQTEAEFKEALGQMTSTFNLSTGRPAIQIFEGIEGFEKALNDSLTASTEILTYFDPDAVVGDIAEVNRRYVKKRRERNISKRIILPDNKAAHDYLAQMGGSHTDVVLAKNFSSGFKTATEIYDNKVVFLTLDQEKIISVILEDSNIARLQREQFEYMWKKENQAAIRDVSSSTSGSIAK